MKFLLPVVLLVLSTPPTESFSIGAGPGLSLRYANSPTSLAGAYEDYLESRKEQAGMGPREGNPDFGVSPFTPPPDNRTPLNGLYEREKAVSPPPSSATDPDYDQPVDSRFGYQQEPVESASFYQQDPVEPSPPAIPRYQQEPIESASFYQQDPAEVSPSYQQAPVESASFYQQPPPDNAPFSQEDVPSPPPPPLQQQQQPPPSRQVVQKPPPQPSSISLDSITSRTERILRRADSRQQSSQATGAGGSTTWAAFQRVEENWAKLKQGALTAPTTAFVSTDAAVSSNAECWNKLRQQNNNNVPLDFDVTVCGGTLGIFFAVALQLKGHRVCVIEAGKLRGRSQEWNISRNELMELVDLGILSEKDVEESIQTEFPVCRSGFKVSNQRRAGIMLVTCFSNLVVFRTRK